jgi:hypothetical protein
MAAYELWQTRSRNLIGAFASAEEAHALVRRAADAHGAAYIDAVLLGYEDDDGQSSTVAQGQDLLKLAQREEGEDATRTAKPRPRGG